MKKGIIIHCSDSEFGSSITIDGWHRKRGWDNIGYHFVICNGFVDNNLFLSCMDGAIERGRDIDKNGAHARGYNETYIGICLIGVKDFTPKQFDSLKILVSQLQELYDIDNDNIMGHYEVNENKTCPNIDMEWLREWLKEELNA
jgi:hypothetical protein